MTFVVAVPRKDQVLTDNFLASPCLAQGGHEILIQEGYLSAATAYNDAIDRATNDLLVFSHHDVIFPVNWLVDLTKALKQLDHDDPKWGVLGCYGETEQHIGVGYIYTPGRGISGGRFDRPTLIQTLDEIVLILRKSSGLRFDEGLSHFHMYGADICLRAEKEGRRNYAISAFCIHNARCYTILPYEFYECCRHIRRKWWDKLPIQTTCIRLTRSNASLYYRRIREFWLKRMPGRSMVSPRVRDVHSLVQEAQAALRD